MENIRMSHTNAKDLSIFDYFEILFRYKKYIIRATLITAIVVVVFSLSLRNLYTSTTLILPPQQESGLIGMLMGQIGGGVTNLASDLLGKGTRSDIYASILRSDEIKDKIIDRFKLMTVYKEKYRLDTYKRLDKNVNIQVGKKDGIISISAVDIDPKRAADIANAFVEELARHSVKLNMDGATQHKMFIEERLTQAKIDLSNAEDKLKTFQSRSKTVDVTEQTKGIIKGIADITGQLMLEEVKLSTLQRQFTDSSQEIKSQKELIKNLRAQILKLETTGNSGTIPSITQVPAIGQEYVRIMREYKIQETLVELLTKQYEISKLDESNLDAAIQVLQKAKVPDKKSSPKRSLIVILATAIVFFVSIVSCFLFEFLRCLPETTKERMLMVCRQLKQ